MQVTDSIIVFSLYKFRQIGDNICMVNENTDAQVKAQLIAQINNFKPKVISHGYDYPTDPNLEGETVENLQEFINELRHYYLNAIPLNEVIEEMTRETEEATVRP